jgi:hypothetical protein
VRGVVHNHTNVGDYAGTNASTGARTDGVKHHVRDEHDGVKYNQRDKHDRDQHDIGDKHH